MNVLEQACEKRAAMDAAGALLTDEQAAECAALFAPWYNTAQYVVGDRARFGERLYRCLQGHTAQPDWTPDAAHSLWARIDDPRETWPAWVQPTGEADAYSKGARVSHAEKHWTSETDANVWEPGVYGWAEEV